MTRSPSRLYRLLAAFGLLASPIIAAAALQPFAGSGSEPAPPWRVVGLPRQAEPVTGFSIVALEGRRALRVAAQASYGNLVHPLRLAASPVHLAWDWRVDRSNTAADLRRRDGDDSALKVCTLWDMPLRHVPFFERQLLRLARSRTNEPLPSATVCYVWDSKLPRDTELVSPYTGRLRYLVLRGAGDPLQRWAHERRDIAADFTRLFGAETNELPPLVGVAVGADADNTRMHSLGHLADLRFEP